MVMQERKKKMNNIKNKSKGTISMIIGTVLLLIALAIVGYNTYESSNAQKISEDVVEQFETKKDTDVELEKEMPTIEIEGNYYIGILEIPDYNISLPVMDSWSYDKLKIAPCVYSGSYFSDDIVIIGHNYSSIFNSIRFIKPNTDVYLTTADDRVLHYVVDYAETLKPEYVDKLTDKTDWDLTLLTCNKGNQTRRTVRCIRVEK
ncbi:MAG: sortase [Ruminococcus sp.]|nr:sortase [Ruminococcus sp.]